jgi:DNA-binding MarR family transcriptional regulator
MQEATRRPAAKKLPRVANTEEKNAKAALDLTALQRTPGYMIRILQLHIFDEFFEYFAAAGFSPAEHSALITVRDNPFVTQSEVAVALRIQLPNLVKILLKLETKGLIKRKRSSRDKRAVELVLTARGQKAAVQAATMADEFNQLTLSPLSESERKQFLQMLSRLVDARTRNYDQDSPG